VIVVLLLAESTGPYGCTVQLESSSLSRRAAR
jgi:hypothetical protein